MLELACLLTFALQCWNLYLLHALGKRSYLLIIAVYSGYFVVEAYLAVTVTWAMGLFLLVNLWAISTALLGWWRERKTTGTPV